MKRFMKALRVLLPVLILIAAAPRAEAKIFEVWGSGLAGYGYGDGKTGKDFYRWVRGGAAGFEVGAKIFFIGAFVDYLYWFGGDESASLITFNLGGDFPIELTDSWVLVLRAAGGYYHGLLPSSATREIDGVMVKQVNTRGIGVRGGVGIRYKFFKVFSLGLGPEIGYHYFFGGKEDSIIDDNSSGYDLTILGYLRIGLGF